MRAAAARPALRGARPQGPGGPLRRHRDFRLLWCGQTTAKFGTAVGGVAMPLVALTALRADTFEVGVVGAAAWLPWLLVGLPAGAWVDRLPRRAVMVCADVAALVLFGSVPVAAWCGVLTMAHLLAVALLGGVAAVFFQTAYSACLPGLLDPRDQAEGNARLHGSASAAQIAGQSAGGLLAQAAGAGDGLAANAAGFAVSLLCLARIRHREPPRTARRDGTRLRHEVAVGLRLVLGDR
ncbi:major facilitator transporter [Streptantibioticus cattleyicolor NRRL 8057 = DSM 46488]|uniref:Major facilitator transporter n=1 Tax=Streptantibioticus cattleyicolor (strain ATCC 35852 / DSM 46488 / JCM 4925 / NBRC 14057 / NRRL 8057) TaxID=1003195 RepID=F8JNS9_STREN